MSSATMPQCMICHVFPQVLDFLFLVGELEEAKFDGDSAEIALVACKDDFEKVLI